MRTATALQLASCDLFPAALVKTSPNFRHVRALSCPGNELGNVIIHGENSRALLALGQDIVGAVRCVYMDPPYNNNETYNHYVDRWAHSHWLEEIEQRIRLFHHLLRHDGSLWISIDDSEV